MVREAAAASRLNVIHSALAAVYTELGLFPSTSPYGQSVAEVGSNRDSETHRRRSIRHGGARRSYIPSILVR